MSTFAAGEVAEAVRSQAGSGNPLELIVSRAFRKGLAS
jgi:hypothetical protein